MNYVGYTIDHLSLHLEITSLDDIGKMQHVLQVFLHDEKNFVHDDDKNPYERFLEMFRDLEREWNEAMNKETFKPRRLERSE